MTIIVSDRTKHAVTSMIVDMRQWLSFRRQFRGAKAELMALDDHTLKDIGLDRSEIESVLTDRNRERRKRGWLPLAA
jgi:uncharacterized protein YjiS (DUF1127 family)